MTPLSPQQVIGGINRGEARARAWIYEKYLSQVYTTVRNLIPGSPEIDDIVQETFHKLFRNEGKFLRIKSIVRFLNTTANSLCIGHQRHQKIVRRYEESQGVESTMVTEETEEYMKTLSHHRALIYRAMEEVPEKCKKPFFLHYAKGMNNREIAELLGLKEQTVANHRATALRVLRQSIKDKPDLNFLTIFL